MFVQMLSYLYDVINIVYIFICIMKAQNYIIIVTILVAHQL